MRFRSAISLAVVLLLSPCLLAADDKAQKAVDDYLAGLKADTKATAIGDDAVGKVLPGWTCFSVVFRQFPVAFEPPDPLKSGNVLAVKDGKVTAISDAAALEKFVTDNLAAVKDEATAKAAATAWVRLSQVLHQDGFFKFSIPEKGVTGDTGKASATAEVEKKGGDSGAIAVTLTFKDGKLTKVEEKAEVKAGVRPRCQATRLLDADPVVREIMEKDLLVMGRRIKWYLDEQRAKASPELKKEIDRVWQRIVDEGW